MRNVQCDRCGQVNILDTGKEYPLAQKVESCMFTKTGYTSYDNAIIKDLCGKCASKVKDVMNESFPLEG